MPKISIITATFNAAKVLETLIRSIISQKDSDVEFIIIDGQSKDNTLEIIKLYEHHIDYWLSEPDKGIYDAWNKGVSKATGDWIMFLGADDELLPNAILEYQRFLKNPKSNDLDLISSKLRMVDTAGKLIRYKGWSWEWPLFLKEVTIAHPGALHSIKLFKNFGYFDINYKITGDYEFLLRPQGKLKSAFIDALTVQMSEGGASDTTAAIREHYKAATTTGGQTKMRGLLNYYVVYSKFCIKKIFRAIGFNIYLKK